MVLQDSSYDIKHVQQIVKDKFDFEVPYHKAWHALKAAREQVYGTWESSVQKLPKYMTTLQNWNPGAVVEWLHLETDSQRRYMLNYIFWGFRPCIEGYRYCRDVISVDGTHLYTKYKHKMLVAVTLDANQQVLPLAFALVDEKSLASCRWFLRMLSKYLLPSEDDRVCLISDRHVEIKSLNEEAYDWLGRIDKAQWMLAHDGGWRTGILTTNISETLTNNGYCANNIIPLSAVFLAVLYTV
ncbi:UNVERIFIED_CONTAM: hypothetical protein Sindi_0983000 [Sesamum indicum]